MLGSLIAGFAAEPVAGEAAAVITPQQGVLVVYSDARVQPGLITIDEAIRAQLASRPSEQLAYYNEFMDTNRFPAESHQQRLADYLTDKYRGVPIDVVLCVREAAFTFMMRHRNEIAPGAPMLHLAVPSAVLAATAMPDDVTGIGMEVDAGPVVALARRLHPDATIVVVGGTSSYDEQWLASFRRELAGQSVRWLVGIPLEQVVAEVTTLPQSSVLMCGYFGADATGRTYIPIEAGESILRASSVPSYVCYSSVIGRGATAGVVFDLSQVGSAAGAAVARLLDGERPQDLQVTNLHPEQVMADWRELRRWGIAESALPLGSQILFRKPSFWELYRNGIFLTAAVIAIQAVLIVALLVNRRRLRRAQARLIEGEQRMSLATEAAKLGIWMWDISRDEVWSTEECRRLLGIGTHERFSFERFLTCVHGDDHAETEARVRAAVASGSTYEHEYRVSMPDGAVRWIAGRGRVERDSQGKARRMLGVLLDISERKQMEDDVERHRTELAHLSRVSSLGDLSSSIAHELNQPLTAILSNAQAALRYLERPQPDLMEVREILGDIARQDQRAGDVIRRMRAMLRKDGTHMDILDLRQVVDEVLSMMRSDLIARNVTCVTDLGPAPALVRGDRVQLQQVLINLVANACDAMAAQPPERRRLVATIASSGPEVLCEVIDHGLGIENHERIFHPFYSTKPHGIGMGLSICRSITTVHSGSLTAHDNPAGGAAMRLRLPAVGEVAS